MSGNGTRDPGAGGPVRIVLLHSNDIHGDFEGTDRNGIRHGGLALLSGMLQKIRREEETVLYAIAGDMFMGSIIDREYRGLSTIRMMNALEPALIRAGTRKVKSRIPAINVR